MVIRRIIQNEKQIFSQHKLPHTSIDVFSLGNPTKRTETVYAKFGM
jgi:hypothetical protein